MTMEDAKRYLENVSNKEVVRDNLSFIALYVGLYESFVHSIVDRVEGFLSNGFEKRTFTSEYTDTAYGRHRYPQMGKAWCLSVSAAGGICAISGSKNNEE